MSKEIRLLLVFLIIALAVLVYLQNQQCSAIPNEGRVQHFTTDNNNNNNKSPNQTQQNQLDDRVRFKNSRRALSMKDGGERTKAARESQRVNSKIVDNILKNDKSKKLAEQELDSLIQNEDMQYNYNNNMRNPLGLDVDSERNTLPGTDQEVLDELIREVNTGNDLQIDEDSKNVQIYKNRSNSIDTATKGYRKISYADSAYRMNFNDEADNDMTNASQDELNEIYADALIFKNSEYSNNDNFKGNPDGDNTNRAGGNQIDQIYGNADLKAFSTQGPESQQEKILNLYNSNNYLPNDKLLSPELTKGFQILENPVSVTNTNLIPVLKSIPVSSVLGSKRNSTWDIRAEPPCPKTVVSPFLNSSIMPDIYATQRGCL